MQTTQPDAALAALAQAAAPALESGQTPQPALNEPIYWLNSDPACCVGIRGSGIVLLSIGEHLKNPQLAAAMYHLSAEEAERTAQHLIEAASKLRAQAAGQGAQQKAATALAESGQGAIETVAQVSEIDFLSFVGRRIRSMNATAMCRDDYANAAERHAYWSGCIAGLTMLCMGLIQATAAFDALAENSQRGSLAAWSRLAHNIDGLPAAQVQQLLQAQGIDLTLEQIANLHIAAKRHVENIPITVTEPMRQHIAAARAFVDHFNGLHERIVSEAKSQGGAA